MEAAAAAAGGEEALAVELGIGLGFWFGLAHLIERCVGQGEHHPSNRTEDLLREGLGAAKAKELGSGFHDADGDEFKLTVIGIRSRNIGPRG